MGKRSNFERREADFYPTPRAAVVPLIPYLRGIRTFAEPCAGDGDLVRHLEEFGLRCVYAGDIRSGQDALALDHYGAADAIITNPPWSRDLMHGLIAHFQNIAPTWLLLDADWAHDQAGSAVPAPLLGHRGDRPREMDRGLEAHRQGQCALVQVRYPGIRLVPSSTGAIRVQMVTSIRADRHLRAMPQGLRAAAIQFTVLFADVQAAALIARGLA